MAEELHQLVVDLSDEEFEALYGPLARLRPDEAADLLDGFDPAWWIVGGWAIEAFTGRHRGHDDVDVCVLAGSVPDLIEHFLPTHNVWAAGAGCLCPVLSADQRLPEWAHQFWIRTSATEPWLLDIIVTPERDGRWVFRRDPGVDAELDAVTWVHADGIRYQNPEVTLAAKAAHDRPKDVADLDATLPLLSDPARAWLAATVDRLHPGHRWSERLADDAPARPEPG